MRKETDLILKLILIYITLVASNQDPQTIHSINPKQDILEFIFDSATDDDFHIKALSYNVWGLPIWVPGQNQSNRFRKVSDSILIREFEIICLQEVFHPKIRKNIMDKLAPKYFTASNYDCNQPIFGKVIQKDCHGGLMTLSKFPIIDEAFYRYSEINNGSIIEKIGSKGFLFSTIIWNDQIINVINTHLYAGTTQKSANCRLHQIQEMEQILLGLESYQKYPTLLFGDLNIIHPYTLTGINHIESAQPYEYLMQSMGFIDTVKKLDKNSYTINSDINVYGSTTEAKQKLDYIMIHLPYDSDQCIWLDNQKIDFFGRSALSDHMGWTASINIEPNNKIRNSKNDAFVGIK